MSEPLRVLEGGRRRRRRPSEAEVLGRMIVLAAVLGVGLWLVFMAGVLGLYLALRALFG